MNQAEMNRTKLLPLITLFSSASTLVCCALPALFVALGMGAVFAGLVSSFPQLIWLSEHKASVFVVAGILLSIAGIAQYRARNAPCPIDLDAARACDRARKISKWAYVVSVVIYLIGAGFAFIPQM